MHQHCNRYNKCCLPESRAEPGGPCCTRVIAWVSTSSNETPELWLADKSGSEPLSDDHVGLCESNYQSVRWSVSKAYLDNQRLRKLVWMLLSNVRWEFIRYWIIFRLTAIVVDLGSVKNGVLVDRSKGMGVVATSRVIRRRYKISRMSSLTSHNKHK